MDTYGKRLAHALTLPPERTRAELGAAVGITEQAVGSVIRSKISQLKARHSALAARYLRVDHHWLATGEGEARPRPPLSPLALDLAEAFDATPLAAHDRLHALVMNLLDVATSLRRGEAPLDLPATLGLLSDK